MKLWATPALLLCPCGYPMEQVREFDVATGIATMRCGFRHLYGACKQSPPMSEKCFAVQMICIDGVETAD